LGKNQPKPIPVDPSPKKKIHHSGFVDVDFLKNGKVRQPPRIGRYERLSKTLTSKKTATKKQVLMAIILVLISF
jgi:hypothetical protein